MPPRGLPSHVVGQPYLPGYLLCAGDAWFGAVIIQTTSQVRGAAEWLVTHQFSGDMPPLSVAERGMGFRAQVDPAGLTPVVTKVPLM